MQLQAIALTGGWLDSMPPAATAAMNAGSVSFFLFFGQRSAASKQPGSIAERKYTIISVLPPNKHCSVFDSVLLAIFLYLLYERARYCY